MARSTSRRTFMKAAVAAGAALPLVSNQKLIRAQAPKQKLRVAFIGTGGMGGGMLEKFNELGVECPCYCDVDTARFEKATKRYPKAKPYQDYREMYDKEMNNFDAVSVGTPDHQHYPATIIAMRAKKHAYVQKPLTHTVWEARELTKAAKEHGVVTQMGNQGHAGEGWRTVYAYIKGGAIGDVTEVHSWTNRPIWKQGQERPAGEDPVPSTLNWDAWIGPAPMRPYKGNKTYHDFSWRGWWDFGAGALGDMACHTQDGIFWALDPGYPTAVEALRIEEMTKEQFPNRSIIKWEYAAKGDRPAFTSFWYDGGLKPEAPAELEEGKKLPASGNLFIGTKGKLLVEGDYGDKPRLIPEPFHKEVGEPKRLLKRSPGHYEEWVQACTGEDGKDKEFPGSKFSYSGPFTESILLGNVAMAAGKRLEFDGANLKFTNAPQFDHLLTKEYRQGWKF